MSFFLRDLLLFQAHQSNVSFDSNDDGPDEADANIAEGDWSWLIRCSVNILQQFENFVAGLADLETVIGDIQAHFSGVFKQDKLSEELKLLEKYWQGKRRAWRSKAEQSIVQLFTINKYQEAARAISEAARALGLTSSFRVVEQILSSVGDEAAFRCSPLKEVRKQKKGSDT